MFKMKKCSSVVLVFCMLLSMLSAALPVSAANDEQTMPPLSVAYTIDNPADGLAEGTVTVTLPKDHGADDIYLYWGDDDGRLAGYGALAPFKVAGTETTHRMTNNTVIPEGATRLLAYSYSDTTGMSETYAETALPIGCNFSDPGEPIAKLQVVSDTHVQALNSLYTQHFKGMLEDIAITAPDSLGVFVVGDTVDNGFTSQYEKFMEVYNSVEGAPPIFMGIGNHETWGDAKTYDALVELFTSYATLPDGTHPESINYDFWLNGYHFIFLGNDEFSSTAYFYEDTLNWLDETLAENRDITRPTFVFLHQSISNTVAGGLAGQGWSGVGTESALRAVLQKYPEVMFWNGHSHWVLNSYGTMYERDVNLPTAFNTAAVAYLSTSYDRIGSEDVRGSEGYYVEIYEDKVLVRGRDFENNQWLPSAYFFVDYREDAFADSTTPDGSEPVGSEPARDSGNHFEVNKTVFREGEPIEITALAGDGNDWIGIGEGSGPSIIWYYVKDAGLNTPINLRDTENGVLNVQNEMLSNLPAGNYTIAWLENDANFNTREYSVDIIIVGEDGTTPGTVVPVTPTETKGALNGSKYNIENPANGSAKGKLVAYLPYNHGAESVSFWWADDNGKLEETAFATSSVSGSIVSLTVPETVSIPESATKVLVYTESEQFGVSADICVIELPDEDPGLNLISTDKTEYTQGEKVYITLSVDGSYGSEDWVGIGKVGASSNSASIAWEYVGEWTPGTPTTITDFDGSALAPGSYIVGLVRNGGNWEGGTRCGNNFVIITIQPPFEMGDVNKDGRIDSKDARLILQFTVEAIELTSEQQALADSNGDGDIDSKDARKILQTAVL